MTKVPGVPRAPSIASTADPWIVIRPSSCFASCAPPERTLCRPSSPAEDVDRRWVTQNRLHEARRYDRPDGAVWELAARQRYRYDSANQRTVKQSFDEAGAHRAALFVYPGDFERRGLEVSADGESWEALEGSESQYLIAGARVVWQNRQTHASLIDPEHRITFAITNLIGSTNAVIDLVSGELVEVGGFYPNGARETLLGADAQVNGADVPIEPVGFTGKEADEEVGLTYFGERYLIPRIGRWATPDPAEIHASSGGEALNSYHYISGNLLQARDPLGLFGDREGSAQDHAVTGALSGEKQASARTDESQASSFTPAQPPVGTGGPGGWGEGFDWAIAREGKAETWYMKPKGGGDDAWARAEGFSSWQSGDQPSGDRANAVDDVDHAVDAASVGGAFAAKKLLSVGIKALSKDTAEIVIKKGGQEAAEVGTTEVAEAGVQYGPVQQYGPFQHQLNKGGYEDILSSGELRSTTARYSAGGGDAVRAAKGELQPVGEGGRTTIEFFTPVKPVQPIPHLNEVKWPIPAGETIPISVTRVARPGEAIERVMVPSN